MFQNLKIFEDEFTNSFLKNKKYNSVLILGENTAFIDFKTQGNKGIFKVSLESNFRVKGNKKKKLITTLTLNRHGKKYIYEL